MIRAQVESSRDCSRNQALQKSSESNRFKRTAATELRDWPWDRRDYRALQLLSGPAAAELIDTEGIETAETAKYIENRSWFSETAAARLLRKNQERYVPLRLGLSNTLGFGFENDEFEREYHWSWPAKRMKLRDFQDRLSITAAQLKMAETETKQYAWFRIREWRKRIHWAN